MAVYEGGSFKPGAALLGAAYQPDAVGGPPAMRAETAFLKVRYKPPGQSTSRLMTRPITAADAYGRVEDAPEAGRWGLAAAGFGQKLRGDPWMGEQFGWRQIGALAQGACGEDPFGLRAEFVQLVRAAESARSVNE